MKKFFDEFDKDGSGEINCSELKALCEACGMSLSEEEVNAKLERMDKSGDGKISFEEFTSGFS